MRSSIIIAAHNEGDRLVNTVRSTVETTRDLDCEIVVADDASTDGSIDEVALRFPEVRSLRQSERRGGPSNKHRGAKSARGEVLVFLDGHCKPEPGSIAQVVADVELLDGQALVTPRVPTLDVRSWENDMVSLGQGYKIDLETFACEWTDTRELKRFTPYMDRLFYQQPALNGCCFAMSAGLYEKLWGFDGGMRMWGVEDLDLGLKAWMLGHPIVQDPECYIGHRFQTEFSYAVPLEHVVANALRMARKNFGDDTWDDWVERYRRRKSEWPWDAAWRIFAEGQETVAREREYLRAHRVHDEFWYAAEFEVGWPLGLLACTGQRNTNPNRAQETSRIAGSQLPSLEPKENSNECDHRHGLLIENQCRPRNRTILAAARISASTRTADGATLTLFVKLTRTGRGVVEVERVTFQLEPDDPALPYASLLTQRVAGRPLSHVRSVEAKDLLEAFGVSAEIAPTAQTVVDAWQKCLEQI